jgi:hypothetical protein
MGRSDRKPTRKLKCSCQTISNAIPLAHPLTFIKSYGFLDIFAARMRSAIG